MTLNGMLFGIGFFVSPPIIVHGLVQPDILDDHSETITCAQNLKRPYTVKKI